MYLATENRRIKTKAHIFLHNQHFYKTTDFYQIPHILNKHVYPGHKLLINSDTNRSNVIPEHDLQTSRTDIRSKHGFTDQIQFRRR